MSVAPPFYGLLLSGTVVIEGCTFDLAGITGDSTFFQQATIQRMGSLNLIYRNNAYIVPSGENFPLIYNASSSDTLTFDHNAYVLGAGTVLARSFNGTSGNDLTFAQWQSRGFDCVNSTLNATLNLSNEVPQSTSPLNNAGADLGVMADFTGTVYTHRNTIGTYQGSAAFKAPQSISGFSALQNYTVGTQTLPATTSAGPTITYTVVSGPATVSGPTLTITGTGTIVLTATQAGNSSNTPISTVETINATPTSQGVDTPTMPQWALILLAGLLAFTATGRRGPRRSSIQ